MTHRSDMGIRARIHAYRIGFLLGGLLLICLIRADSTHACSCWDPRDPWEARAMADAVFSGTAVQVTENGPMLTVTFRVNESWKGTSDDRVTVRTAVGAACGFPFEENQEYIVYARGSRSQGLQTTMCTRTAYLTHATEDLEAFEETVYLGSNYPEPFNPETTIIFGLSEPAHVSLRVYDRTGQLIRTLVDGRQPAGTARAAFDGSGLASGVYFYRLQTGNIVKTRTMVLVR